MIDVIIFEEIFYAATINAGYRFTWSEIGIVNINSLYNASFKIIVYSNIFKDHLM